MAALVFVTLIGLAIGLALLAVLGIIFKENKNAVKVIKSMMIVMGITFLLIWSWLIDVYFTLSNNNLIAVYIMIALKIILVIIFYIKKWIKTPLAVLPIKIFSIIMTDIMFIMIFQKYGIEGIY